MSKRASLSLSVEAIVILVLAITMLGLGISFTKGIFDKFKINVDIELPAPTDASPIEVPPGEIQISRTGGTQFPLKFKNIGNSAVSQAPNIGCDFGGTVGVIDAGSTDVIAIKVLGVTLNPGESASYKVIVPKTGNNIPATASGIYACKISFCPGTASCFSTGATGVVEKQFIGNIVP